MAGKMIPVGREYKCAGLKLKLSETDLVKLAADFGSDTLYTLSCRKQ